MEPRNALSTRLQIEHEHPEIIIRSPLISSSHMWELEMDNNGTSFWEDFWAMAHAIADRYPDVKGVVNG